MDRKVRGIVEEERKNLHTRGAYMVHPESDEGSSSDEAGDNARESVEPEKIEVPIRHQKRRLQLWYSCQGQLGGPPVDDDKLRKLERDELTEEERHSVLNLIATYHEWMVRSDRIHREEVHRWNESISDDDTDG